jgi:phage terminase small subunit
MPRHVHDLTPEGLTPKELQFVEQFRGNATAAARAAGYKSPAKAGMSLLRRPQVKAAVETRAAKASAKAQVTREEVEQFLADTMRQKRAVRRGDRLKAAEQLTRLNAWDKAPSSVVIPVIGIKIET